MSTQPRSGVTRRRLLRYLGWAGTGLLWTVRGALPVSLRAQDAQAANGRKPEGFIPDAGYGFSGTPAFDGTFTITNASNPFGATGPNIQMFDDGRNGVAGQLMTSGATPTFGPARWQRSSGGSAGTPVIWRGGSTRSGLYHSFRMLDNERAGGSVFGRSMNIPFGADYNQIYVFYAEHWHGWDGRNHEGGVAGGYYKWNWLQNGGYAGGSFNQMFPTFLAATTPAGIRSPDIKLLITGNDSTGNGPLPTWYAAGDSNGISKFDANGWNSLELVYFGDVAKPTANPGFMRVVVWNTPNKQALNADSRRGGALTTNILFAPGSGPKGTYGSFNNLQFLGLMQNIGSHTIDRSDLYIAVGPQCQARFFIGDAVSVAKCTTIMPCTIGNWSAGSVTMTLRQGGFARLSGNWLYWSDVSNNISRVGQFT